MAIRGNERNEIDVAEPVGVSAAIAPTDEKGLHLRLTSQPVCRTLDQSRLIHVNHDPMFCDRRQRVDNCRCGRCPLSGRRRYDRYWRTPDWFRGITPRFPIPVSSLTI